MHLDCKSSRSRGNDEGTTEPRLGSCRIEGQKIATRTCFAGMWYSNRRGLAMQDVDWTGDLMAMEGAVNGRGVQR